MTDPVTRRAARLALLAAVPAALLAGVGTFAALGGFDPDQPETPPRTQSSDPVVMPASPLAERPAAVCRELISRLPSDVRELRRRSVTAGSEQNAAYGDPAITLSCGGPAASYPPDAQLWQFSGICWYAERRADGSLWTTLDREVPVSVAVPADHRGAGDWVAGLGDAIRATVPAALSVPKGCA